MTGEELKALRLTRRWSRRILAEKAEVHPDSVRYWEGKGAVDLRGHAPRLMLTALGVHTETRFGYFETNTRARDRLLALTEQTRAQPRRTRCGARTRKGTPCRANAVPGKTRCKFHGGMSTGPKSPEGSERIAEAQRRRWANRLVGKG